jgi:isocitrate/isopropylmalate dehydrogenase
MAMLLACAAVLEHAGIQGDERATAASKALRDATLSTATDGIRCFDLGGSASTSEVVDEVVARMRNR